MRPPTKDIEDFSGNEKETSWDCNTSKSNDGFAANLEGVWRDHRKILADRLQVVVSAAPVVPGAAAIRVHLIRPREEGGAVLEVEPVLEVAKGTPYLHELYKVRLTGGLRLVDGNRRFLARCLRAGVELIVQHRRFILNVKGTEGAMLDSSGW